MKDKQLIVHKANELIESSYHLTTQEQRIILYMISKLNPYKEKEFQKLKISIKDFCELTGISHGSVYNEIMNITRKLRRRELIIKKPESDLVIGWLSSAEYFTGEGFVELEFSPKLSPYLLQLQELYTPYNLKDVIRLRLTHSFRIYELCKQYQNIGSRTFLLQDLKEILGIEKKYPRFGDFKRRVLVPSLKELNEITDIGVKFEEIKKGRRVSAIKFTFSRKSKSLQKPFPEKEINPEFFNRLVKYFCLSTAQASKVMSQYSEARLKKNLDHVERRVKKGEIENIGAYTLKAIQDNITDQVSLFRKEESKKERDLYLQRMRDDFVREYQQVRKQAADEYEKSLESSEKEEIQKKIVEETEALYGRSMGFEKLCETAYVRRLAKLAQFPDEEEWVEKQLANL
ncbi:MAG: replication initiation protein [Desulfobulbaceae bacterium]|nr:replication initiation protein [Desulfobulbaceae bacterium]